MVQSDLLYPGAMLAGKGGQWVNSKLHEPFPRFVSALLNDHGFMVEMRRDNFRPQG